MDTILENLRLPENFKLKLDLKNRIIKLQFFYFNVTIKLTIIRKFVV